MCSSAKNGKYGKCPPLQVESVCKNNTCPCIPSEWSTWSSDCVCGNGTETRFRSIRYEHSLSLCLSDLLY